MKLLCLPTSARVTICLIALEQTGTQCDVEWVGHEDLKTEKVTKHNPQGKVPTLVTDQGALSETTAIIRHIARASGQLYGTGFEQSLVDQWLSWTDSEVNPVAFSIAVQVYGFPVPQGVKLPDLNSLKAALQPKLTYLNTHLEGKKYIVGDGLTIADIAVFGYLYPIFSIYAEKDRSNYPNILSWIDGLFANVASIKKYYGRARYSQAGFQAVKPTAAPKEAAPEKKEKAKKEEKVEEEIKEEKVADPVFPDTQLNLMTFKTFFINEPDTKKAMEEFWNQYKEGEWSLWHLTYIKYPGECEVVYRTNNLLRTFLSRIEHIRKWLFGTHVIIGDEPTLDIEAIWLIRGPELFQHIKEIDAFDTYKWDKLDTSKPENRALVEEFWTNRKEDEDKIQGKTIRTFKWIK